MSMTRYNCVTMHSYNDQFYDKGSGYKNTIELKTLDDFECNIKNYNTWFKNTRNKIIKLEGKEIYEIYTRLIFKKYLTLNNDEIKATLKAKIEVMDTKKAIIEISLPRRHGKTAGTSYNNLLAENEWYSVVKESKPKEENSNFLALIAKIEELTNNFSKNNDNFNYSNNSTEKNTEE